MRELTYGQGIKEGMRIKMLENPDVFIFGEDVGLFGGCFGVTAGLFEEFGEKESAIRRSQKGPSSVPQSCCSRWFTTDSRVDVC